MQVGEVIPQIALSKQSNRHDPESGVYGDCHRTAYAMVLGVHPHIVPHVMDGGASAEDANRAMSGWLAGLGLTEITFPATAPSIEILLSCWKEWSGGMPFVLGGQSKNKCNHSVAVQNGKVFDPALDDSGIIGPCDDGFYWITFIVPCTCQFSITDRVDP